jgi:hypothetical protein
MLYFVLAFWGNSYVYAHVRIAFCKWFKLTNEIYCPELHFVCFALAWPAQQFFSSSATACKASPSKDPQAHSGGCMLENKNILLLKIEEVKEISPSSNKCVHLSLNFIHKRVYFSVFNVL